MSAALLHTLPIRNKSILHTRAYHNGHIDTTTFPKLILQDSGKGYNDLRKSGYCRTDGSYFFVTPINHEKIDDSMTLDWRVENHLPTRIVDSESFTLFAEQTDREFKNIFALMHIKHHNFKNFPVSPHLFNLVLSDYMQNLVFTRWLYKDFVDYKNFIKEQKRKKRVNHKVNVKERASGENSEK